MGKRGPCFHCGVDSTPLWRNGPPEKPVLCNACGSRYRLGKSLENYTPKVFNVDPKKKQKQVAKSTVINNSSSGLGGYYASSESSISHYPNSVIVKQEIPYDYPVKNRENSWRIYSKKRSKIVYSNLTTIQQLHKDLHGILRDEFNGSIESEGVEDVLIYDINIHKLQVPPTEIVLGIILLKFPVASADHKNQQEIRVFPLNHAPTASPKPET